MYTHWITITLTVFVTCVAKVALAFQKLKVTTEFDLYLIVSMLTYTTTYAVIERRGA